MKRLNWGLVTTGRICDWFNRDLVHVDQAHVLAVASRDVEKAKAFAGARNILRAYTYADMLADPDIDIVYIGSPPAAHLDQVRLAMHAGKAVLCEKPLTINAAQTEALIRLQSETRTYVMEAMWTWFLPAIRQAVRWVADGHIGDIVHIKADFGYPQTYDPDNYAYSLRLGGGCLLDMGVYAVALIRHFIKRPPETIQVVSRLAPTGVDDDLSALLDFGDMTATIGASFRAKLQNWAYIIGTEGYIAIPDFWRASEARLYRLDACIAHFQDDRAHQGFAFEAAAVMADALAGRTQSQVMPLSDSLAVQHIMDRIRAAF